MNEEKFWQARRLVFLLKKFQSGYRINTKELQELYLKQGLGDYSLRTVQNDLQLMSEIEPLLENKKEGKKRSWFIKRDRLRRNNLISSNNLLSLYILKAQLKSFKGTHIEEELNRVLDKLEKEFPNDIISFDSLFWDKNIGSYNYEKHDSLIKAIIDSIVKDYWLEIRYDTAQKGNIKNYIGKITKMFSYGGYLYAATFIPKYGYYIALAIHRIDSIRTTDNSEIEVPEFDHEEFSSIRFGVFWGEPEMIELEIMKDFVKYFENRFWHQTQKFETKSNGNLMLKMEVPLSPELISWILSWSEGVIVRKPSELKEKIIYKMEETLSLYQDY